MITEIWKGNNYGHIKPEEPVNTTKRLRSFCISNNLPDCIFKSQGGYYRITFTGKIIFVFRCLYSVSFEDVHRILATESISDKPN